jgi:beta-lactamase class A
MCVIAATALMISPPYGARGSERAKFSAVKVEEDWKQIAAKAKGRVGIAALVMETGEKAELDGAAHYPTQSVYKLPISMALMQQVEHGKISLDTVLDVTQADLVPMSKGSPIRDKFPHGTKMTVLELLKAMLVQSDGTASDVLMKTVGGPAVVTAYLRSAGVKDWVVANLEKEMDWKSQYDDWCTPEAAVGLLVKLEGKEGAGELSDASREVILGFMRESQTGVERMRRFLPAGTVVADKTGSSGTRDGMSAATNDIGVVMLKDGRHLVVAVFVSDAKAADEARNEVIGKITKRVWDEVE